MIKLLPFVCLLVLASCNTDTYTKVPGNTVRVATATDPTTLDPRYVHDTSTISILHMLFEGLMRVDLDGKVVHGIAENVSISEDQLTYTFKLRESTWSNGDKLTAQDFQRSWLSLLDQKNASPNAYQLYSIKGAQEYHLGRNAADTVGIKTADENKLIVILKEPTPYFLDLIATYFYYPVHPDGKAEVIGNGPFKLDSWKRNDSLLMSRNRKYWDAYAVNLDHIEVILVDETTALHMYQKEEVDWIGSPMSEIPQDAVASLRAAHILHFAPAAGTHWFRFNTQIEPFTSEKIRRAFALAINRKEIVDHITQGSQMPARGLVPPLFKTDSKPFFNDHDTAQAWNLFQEALVEMHLDKETFPSVALCYKAGDRAHKIAQAVQQQWQKTFDIEIKLEACENKHYFERVAQGNYMVSSGSWYADFADPINFLDIFKYKTNASNSSKWENEHYISLLEASAQETDSKKRQEYLESAEEILMHEMPIAPLFFGEFNYAKRRSLTGVYLSPLGYLDFKDARFSELESVE